MKILSVDIGTGTQDIFLLDTQLDVENGFKMVMPSPTMIVHRKIMERTKAGEPILLTGVTMGGGPSHWAVEGHLKAGYGVFATQEAARSFNDDLDYVREQGIEIVSEDEAKILSGKMATFELKDYDHAAISRAFEGFGISLSTIDALVVGVFDHGAAPAGYSDRKFRFEYIEERIISEGKLSAFAYLKDEIPPIMTRLQATANSASALDVPIVVMDTAPAAVMGTTLDPVVAQKKNQVIVNIGNFHTLAFTLDPDGIAGVFEHHTGLLDQKKMENLIISLTNGSLTDEYVFEDHGHGARVFREGRIELEGKDTIMAITGPRRGMMLETAMRPYFPAPYGDMMLLGCFGMIASAAEHLPMFKEPILEALSRGSRGTPPWEVGD